MLANDGLFAFYVNSPVLTAGEPAVYFSSYPESQPTVNAMSATQPDQAVTWTAIAMAEASGHTTNVPLVFIPEVGAPHRLDTDAV